MSKAFNCIKTLGSPTAKSTSLLPGSSLSDGCTISVSLVQNHESNYSNYTQISDSYSSILVAQHPDSYIILTPTSSSMQKIEIPLIFVPFLSPASFPSLSPSSNNEPIVPAPIQSIHNVN